MDTDNDKKVATQIEKEVQWWAYAAWTLPFVALVSLFFIEMFGWKHLYQKFIVVGGVSFFSLAVFWWWWAIFKIKSIAILMSNASDKFKELQQELSKFKNNLKN